MKTSPWLALALAFSITVDARDFRPVTHFENIAAGDSSIQQCYVLKTLPGVQYVVESTHDLSTWTTEDEVYGLGQEYVVTMRQYTPPPPPPPCTPPAVLPPPSKNVSLRLERATGPAGGTVVSWRSLDNGGPVVVRIAGELDAGWSRVPIYSERYGSFYFFLCYPVLTVAPPAENSVLGVNDSAMLAVFEASLPVMNQQVIDSVARSRNAPLAVPLPADPNSRKFWRVKLDADIDTDSDGSPDWSEFEIAARGTGMLVPGVIGNAFDADTNHDGIPDGQQLDGDLDATADAHDVDAADNTAVFSIGPVPRYAVFPINNAEPAEYTSALQISDKGTVLYENGTWTAGIWTPLATPGVGEAVYARGINDSNQIIGCASHYVTSNDPEGGSSYISGICYWNGSDGAFTFVSSGSGSAEKFAHPPSDEFLWGELCPGPVLSNDGHFSAFTQLKTAQWYENPTPGYWKLPSGGQSATETTGDHRLDFNQEPNLRWGSGYPLEPFDQAGYALAENHQKPLERLIHAPSLLPTPPVTATNVFVPAQDLVLALPGPNGTGDGVVLSNGTWKVSELYGNALDMAADGTAIGRNHGGLFLPICINGEWTGIDRAAPGLPSEWNSLYASHWDTTPGGWILAKKFGPDDPHWVSAVMLSIRAEGIPLAPSFAEATGVDAYSVDCPAPGNAVQDRIWIMAPAGTGESQVVLKSPLNAETPLKLSGPGIKFGNEDSITLTAGTNTFQIKADNPAASGQDISLKVELGPVESLSKPLGVKIMKARTVKVTIHPVVSIGNGRIPNGPDLVSSKPDLENYLNKIYGPQINVNFVVTVDAPAELDWDNATSSDFGYDPFHFVTTGNGYLDFMGDQSRKEEDTIDNALKDPNADINIYLLGRGKINGGFKRPAQSAVVG